ncbi:MAG: hypothetical protein RI893_754, partial [Pseudomonadota bacterium]
MKSLSSFLFLITLVVSGCANETTVKSAADDQATKAVCANPHNLCSETISAAFDSKGMLWIAWVNNDHIYVQSSNDKGLSFTSPVMVN